MKMFEINQSTKFFQIVFMIINLSQEINANDGWTFLKSASVLL